jgi:hypothetical protein
MKKIAWAVFRFVGTIIMALALFGLMPFWSIFAVIGLALIVGLAVGKRRE